MPDKTLMVSSFLEFLMLQIILQKLFLAFCECAKHIKYFLFHLLKLRAPFLQLHIMILVSTFSTTCTLDSSCFFMAHLLALYITVGIPVVSKKAPLIEVALNDRTTVQSLVSTLPTMCWFYMLYPTWNTTFCSTYAYIETYQHWYRTILHCFTFDLFSFFTISQQYLRSTGNESFLSKTLR